MAIKITVKIIMLVELNNFQIRVIPIVSHFHYRRPINLAAPSSTTL